MRFYHFFLVILILAVVWGIIGIVVFSRTCSDIGEVITRNNDATPWQAYQKLDGHEYIDQDIKFSIVVINGQKFIVTTGNYHLTGPIDLQVEKE